MAEVVHQIELHRRGETPAQSAFRVLQAANQLGVEGCKIVGLKEHYRLGDLTMDVIVERNGDVLVLNKLGDGFNLHSGAAEIPREARCVVALDGTWIKCLGCGLTSYNVNDVQKLYCGFCHRFSRRSWMAAARRSTGTLKVTIRRRFRCGNRPSS
jgi:ribosomal protein L37E